jgi:hypothetical protein
MFAGKATTSKKGMLGFKRGVFLKKILLAK